MCTPEEWVQLDLAGGVKPPLRMLTLNLLFTMETEEGVTRLGHPRSLRLANTVSLNSVERLVSGVVSAQVPRVAPVALVLVKEDGEWCSRYKFEPHQEIDYQPLKTLGAATSQSAVVVAPWQALPRLKEIFS